MNSINNLYILNVHIIKGYLKIPSETLKFIANIQPGYADLLYATLLSIHLGGLYASQLIMNTMQLHNYVILSMELCLQFELSVLIESSQLRILLHLMCSINQLYESMQIIIICNNDEGLIRILLSLLYLAVQLASHSYQYVIIISQI